MKTLIFVDLDDTLFQTPRKCPSNVTLLPATSNPEGGIGSYMTHAQRALFDRLCQDSLLIPTTARDSLAFGRVHLAFRDLAILNNGATIRNPDGTLDGVWAEHITVSLERIQAQMNLFLEDALLFAGHHDLGVKIYPIVEQDQALYLVCKHPQKDLKTLERVKEFWRERLEQTRADFYLTSNDNNVALLPNCITKRAAVEYVLNDKRARDEYLALGIGDSLSDLGFMDVCDFWITPRGSQIAKQLGM